jgi:hypothetical protein
MDIGSRITSEVRCRWLSISERSDEKVYGNENGVFIEISVGNVSFRRPIKIQGGDIEVDFKAK